MMFKEQLLRLFLEISLLMEPKAHSVCALLAASSRMDTFDPEQYGSQKTMRLATMIIYLSDVEEGGETVFKKEGLEGAGKWVVQRLCQVTSCDSCRWLLSCHCENIDGSSISVPKQS
eukprot:GHUV01013359.1.p4 GENE.GHUV01013359.1~~GHUV01013359.1.p4  ORF type:complete len:117 (+),score=18.91 GHUV01013359.1:2269-2619(+)